MKQYDSIWFPHRKMNAGEYIELDGCGLEEIEGPIIVLNIEEAKEMWKRSVELFYGLDIPNIDEIISEDFKTYLQYKGINI